MRTKIDTTLNLDTLFKLTHDLTKKGRTIGFTHGAFDLFHSGHLYLLTQASLYCDFLIVSVDSDENIKKYKNIEKSVFNQDARVEILNSISVVGNAFINTNSYSDDWYALLYKELNIRFLAIGRNFFAEKAVRNLTAKLEIELLKFDDDLNSKTRIINKVIRRN